jgi:FkbM family methyltransferase
MAYSSIKKIAHSIGLYPQARWFNSHVLNRAELHQEKAEAAFYAKFIHQGDLVFDVGANFGEKTRAFLRLGANVIAFEPQPECMEELKACYGRNPRLRTVQGVLGAKPGKHTFYIFENKGACSLIRDWGWGGAIESEIQVSMFTLDQMIAQYGRPSFIKIDVEGYEYEVFKGLTKHVPCLSFEYHLREDDIVKTINCIHHLATLGELQMNITPYVDLVFLYPQWLTKEKFLQLFPAEILKKQEYSYGDIFVRISA